jgi:hypothetical protein
MYGFTPGGGARRIVKEIPVGLGGRASMRGLDNVMLMVG